MMHARGFDKLSPRVCPIKIKAGSRNEMIGNFRLLFSLGHIATAFFGRLAMGGAHRRG